MPETTAPATVPASNGGTSSAATGSQEPAVEQHRDSATGATIAPVEPDTPDTTDDAKAKAKASNDTDAEKAELKARLEKAEETIREISLRDRKRRDSLNEERKQLGNFEALYTETKAELETASLQLTTATEQITSLQKALKAKDAEIEELRKIELESFQVDPPKGIEKLSIAEIRALRETLHGGTVTQALPSPGVQRPNGRVTTNAQPQTREEYNARKFGGR